MNYCGLNELTLHLQAQDTTTIEGKIRYLFDPLDKSEMATDILIQQSPVFLWPGVYNGIHVPDSLALSRSQWGMLYGQFRGASVGTPYLPDPQIYVDQAMGTHRFGQPVPLMFMATRFDMIRKGAVDDNLFYWDEELFCNTECFGGY